MFHRLWFCLWHLVGVFSDDKLKTVIVMEDDSFTLNSDLTEMRDDDQIHWRFGKYLLAEINKRTDSMTVYDDVLDGRFRNRLKLNNQTGSLTITNIKMKHGGFYTVENLNTSVIFMLIVYDEVTSVSVKEGDSVTLNSDLTEIMDDDQILWLFGSENTIIAEINLINDSICDDVLDGRFRDRLKLDNQTGSLTITNITTQHTGAYILINGAKPSLKAFRVSVYYSVHCCDSVEAVIRLVVTALVGVAAAAAVIVLVYDIRARRAEMDL
uniref:Immunoglobulin domain-containing protein n=1 Tax=Cyprinus carpio TaxID=7962 RepID=A0A8C1KM83_CYPCA